MLVTIIVDASYYHQTKAAGFAYYAISEKGKRRGAMRFKTTVDNASHAELAAIANALHLTLPRYLSYGASKVLVQTDSLTAISLINRERPMPSLRIKDIVASVHGVLEKHSVALELRHVKAHSGTDTKRTYIHDWCDREARTVARKLHDQRLKSPKKKKRPRAKKAQSTAT